MRVLAKTKEAKANQSRRNGTSRYRRDWDAAAKAGWRDTAADTPDSRASTRETSEEQANWDSCIASLTSDITD